jgi:hypothetical protein
MLRKTMIALCAAASVVALTPNMALARGGHGGGGGFGGGGGGGHAGGFGGGGFGGHAGGFGGGFGGHAGGFAAHNFSGGSMNSFARAAPNAAVGAAAVPGNQFAAGGNFAHGGFHHGFHHGRRFFAGGFYGPGFYDDYWDYPDYAYYDDPGYYGYDSNCYIVHRRVHTPYGWRVRPVQVCS